LKKQVELLDFVGFILGMLAGLSFLSRVAKYICEMLDVFNYTLEKYQQFVDEEDAKEAEEKVKKELECKLIFYTYLIN